MITSHLHRSQM